MADVTIIIAQYVECSLLDRGICFTLSTALLSAMQQTGYNLQTWFD